MKTPDFTLTNVRTQETWSLTDAWDHAIMLTFWTSWCPDSINDLLQKQRLYENMEAGALVFMTINVTGREGNVDLAHFLEKHGFTFPVLADEGTHVYDVYGCRGVPTTILLTREGDVAQTFGDKATLPEIMQGVARIL